jgi:hypothetical protein
LRRHAGGEKGKRGESGKVVSGHVTAVLCCRRNARSIGEGASDPPETWERARSPSSPGDKVRVTVVATEDDDLRPERAK